MTRKARTRRPLTPKRLLETHQLTAKLKKLGVTDEQLDRTRFWPGVTRTEPDFRLWVWTGFEGWPRESWGLQKAYCSLKWLLLEDPPDSRNRDDAWREVSGALAVETFEAARNRSAARAPRRRRSAEAVAVVELLSMNLAISEKDVMRALDDRGVTYKLAGFKDRLSRIRKNLSR